MAAHTRSFRDTDWVMVILALMISAVGVLQIFSAKHEARSHDYFWKQLLFVGAGLVVMWIVGLIDYHSLLGHAPAAYIGTIVLLIATLLIGSSVYGGRRWVGVGSFKFQASEFAKLVIILLVARYLSEIKSERLEGRDFLKLCGLVVVPVLLVYKQPDLGTSLTYVPVLVTGVFLAGLSWKDWAITFVVLALAAPIGWFSMKDYQKSRLTSFRDPSRDPHGKGYQVIQSKIAIGQGGMWGQGVTKGTQTRLQFVPMAHTDFIFATFAEEHGFVGVVTILGMYFLLLMQIVQNAQLAPDRAGLYICMGTAAVLLFHILVNVGMLVGRMVVAGIPLPLMSYGGSNTLSVFIMLGLVNNVRLRRFLN